LCMQVPLFVPSELQLVPFCNALATNDLPAILDCGTSRAMSWGVAPTTNQLRGRTRVKMRVFVMLFAVAMLAVPAANADTWTGSGAGPYSGGAVDYWYFNLGSTSTTHITTNDASTNMDTVLTLWDGSGNFLGFNDDDGIAGPCGYVVNTWCSSMTFVL